MASTAKMSVRQRMINMMYLVLTALLALQVSSSIIEKFVFLYQSLEHSKDKAIEANDFALAALKKKVKEEGNTKVGKQKVVYAEELKRKTATTVDEVKKVIDQLINEAGGGPDDHHVVKTPKESTLVETLMIGQGDGLGYDLKKKLNDHVDWLNQKITDWGLNISEPFERLAVDNKDNPIYRDEDDAVMKNKDFAEANFGQTPVIAALAILVQKQAEMVRYEQEVLKELGAKEDKVIKFDEIKGFASADANVVAAGQDYTAQMFLTASASNIKPRMAVNGKPIAVKEGIGDVKFRASGTGDRSWEGTITFKYKGKDTTFRFKKEYTVVEPTLIVNTAAGFPLYQNCANELQTSVPALGASYNPSFSVNNGSVVPGARTGDCTIFPSKLGSCILRVSSGGNAVGDKKFKVNPVPPPNVYLAGSAGRQINLERPIPSPPRLQVKADPDKTFAETLPKEANYRVVGLEVTQFRGGGSVKTQKFNSGQFTFSSAFNPRKGDGFNVKVTAVQRINSRGGVEQAPVLRPNIQFTVK